MTTAITDSPPPPQKRAAEENLDALRLAKVRRKAVPVRREKHKNRLLGLQRHIDRLEDEIRQWTGVFHSERSFSAARIAALEKRLTKVDMKRQRPCVTSGKPFAKTRAPLRWFFIKPRTDMVPRELQHEQSRSSALESQLTEANESLQAMQRKSEQEYSRSLDLERQLQTANALRAEAEALCKAALDSANLRLQEEQKDVNSVSFNLKASSNFHLEKPEQVQSDMETVKQNLAYHQSCSSDLESQLTEANDSLKMARWEIDQELARSSDLEQQLHEVDPWSSFFQMRRAGLYQSSTAGGTGGTRPHHPFEPAPAFGFPWVISGRALVAVNVSAHQSGHLAKFRQLHRDQHDGHK
ncbi:hypothetical protein B0H14DRAFT_2625011 [Mycena olivaceomarginata]|nr:hypothetical protein B0H14DRAFT_2625011 [Mycena olivaceomarginata]